jgi:hypothetical protein
MMNGWPGTSNGWTSIAAGSHRRASGFVQTGLSEK